MSVDMEGTTEIIREITGFKFGKYFVSINTSQDDSNF
jgi:hypothetical protein